MKSRNPTLTRPMTPSTRATMRSGRWRLKSGDGEGPARRASASRAASSPRAIPRSRRSGSARAAASSSCSATFRTEKSLSTKLAARAAKATATKTNWPTAIGRAVASSAGACPCAAPASGEHRLREGERERDDEREVAEFGNHRLCRLLAREGGLVHGMARLLQRVGGLGRHVVLVVLGEHLARLERCRRASSRPCATTPLPSWKRSGRMPVKTTGIVLRGVGHAEAHGERVLVAHDAARLDQAADAEGAVAAAPRCAATWLGREEEHEVRLERVQHERRGHAERGEAGDDPRARA